MILIVFGTRPEIIKLFPVIRKLQEKQVPHKTLFTGQHKDLYEDVKELIPEPDFYFDTTNNNQEKTGATLGESYIQISQFAETLLSKQEFDIVVVQGDTTSACAVSQMAFYNRIAVAHVEAGLRTFDFQNPYPEEMNRCLISQLASLHFAPTQQAFKNLTQMKFKNICLTGNTIVDAVDCLKNELNLSPCCSNKVLVTLHRRENHDIMAQLFDELQTTAVDFPDLELVLPIHPNPNVQKHRERLTASNIRVISPMTYPQILRLINECRFIISDSGGLQEEATCFNKKILVVRKTTERPETIEIGLGRLVGQEIRKNIEWADAPAPVIQSSPYGDGHAARKIVHHLCEFVGTNI